MIRFGVQELEPIGGGTTLCPILPLAVEDFSRAAAIVTPVPGAPEDTIYSGPVILSLQKALSARGATDANGTPCPINGHYTNLTRAVLANWVAQQGISTHLGSVGPQNVTTCAVYRALGIPCSGLEVVMNVTPQAEYIWRLIEQGNLQLSCPGLAPGKMSSVKLLLAGSAIVLGVIWLYVSLNKR